MATKSEALISISRLRLFKENTMLKVLGIKSSEPKLPQKKFSNQLGYSDSTIKRFRDDISMDSHFKTENTQRKVKNQMLQ